MVYFPDLYNCGPYAQRLTDMLLIHAQPPALLLILTLIRHKRLDEGTLFSVKPLALHVSIASLKTDNKSSRTQI